MSTMMFFIHQTMNVLTNPWLNHYILFSMFILLRGASKDEAFSIGKEIAEEITALNPKPVKLKFEKVYQPCVLITKKRYVGYMYESPDQLEPQFDAKGIETVRRDNCPAVGKVESNLLIFWWKNNSYRYIYLCAKQFLWQFDNYANVGKEDEFNRYIPC